MLNLIVPTNGVRAAAAGSKDGQPKGNVSFSYKGANGFTCLIKSNSWQNGYLQFSAEPKVAPMLYTRSFPKGNVQKIDPVSGLVVASFGGHTFEIVTREGDLLDPRQSDSHSITVRSNTNAVFHLVGSQNSLVTPGGGNITNKAK